MQLLWDQATAAFLSRLLCHTPKLNLATAKSSSTILFTDGGAAIVVLQCLGHKLRVPFTVAWRRSNADSR